jgi:type II secretory pathway pseudopilin PulG
MGVSSDPPSIMRRFRPRRCPGAGSFTLVEVVIAIAVIAFVLVSVLGLLAYTSQLVQQADTYARLSNVGGQVLAQINSQPYTVSTNEAGTNAATYFTYEGIPTNSTGAYYQCNFTNANPSTWGIPNVMQIQLTIRWPSPQFVNTNIIITSAVNYD